MHRWQCEWRVHHRALAQPLHAFTKCFAKNGPTYASSTAGPVHFNFMRGPGQKFQLCVCVMVDFFDLLPNLSEGINL